MNHISFATKPTKTVLKNTVRAFARQRREVICRFSNWNHERGEFEFTDHPCVFTLIEFCGSGNGRVKTGFMPGFRDTVTGELHIIDERRITTDKEKNLVLQQVTGTPYIVEVFYKEEGHAVAH